jgi:hypothetical protein
VSAANINAVIKMNRAVAMTAPPGIAALMLDGQSTDGRTNHAKSGMSPSHGGAMSALAGGAWARPNAVSHTIPTMR